MEKEDKKKLIDALLFNLFFLLIIWVIWWVEFEFGHRLTKWGTQPRTLRGAIGIITTPFLHGSLEHISGNTFSFVTLSSFLIFFYRSIAFKVLGLLYVCSGILLWLIAFGGNHIGVSGIIYGLASFLFFSGILRRDLKLLRVSLAVAFIYGSIVWGYCQLMRLFLGKDIWLDLSLESFSLWFTAKKVLLLENTNGS